MIHYLFEHIRYVNFILAAVAVAVMADSSIRRREASKRRTRRVWMWFCLWLMNYMYATGDNIQDKIRLNPPAYFNTFVLFGLILALLWHPDGDEQMPPYDNSMSSRFVFWLDRKVRKHKNRQ